MHVRGFTVSYVQYLMLGGSANEERSISESEVADEELSLKDVRKLRSSWKL